MHDNYIGHQRPTPADNNYEWLANFPNQNLQVKTYANSHTNPFMAIGLLCKEIGGDTLWTKTLQAEGYNILGANNNSFTAYKDRIAINSKLPNNKYYYQEINLDGDTLLEVPVTLDMEFRDGYPHSFDKIDSTHYIALFSNASYRLFNRLDDSNHEADLWLLGSYYLRPLCSIKGLVSARLKVFQDKTLVIGKTASGDKSHCGQSLLIPSASANQPTLLLFRNTIKKSFKRTKSKHSIFSLGPNPAHTSTTLQFKVLGDYDIQLFNNVGQLISGTIIASGTMTHEFNVADVSPGVYFLKVSNSKGDFQVEKVIIR